MTCVRDLVTTTGGSVKYVTLVNVFEIILCVCIGMYVSSVEMTRTNNIFTVYDSQHQCLSHTHNHACTHTYSHACTYTLTHIYYLLKTHITLTIVGDELSRHMYTYADKESFNSTTKESLMRFASYFSAIQDYRDVEVSYILIIQN